MHTNEEQEPYQAMPQTTPVAIALDPRVPEAEQPAAEPAQESPVAS